MENNFSINLIGLLLSLGAVQGIFLSILLFSKYRTHPANRYLGLLVLLYSLFIFNFMLSELTFFKERFPHLLMILSGLPFLFGPFHLIYVGELTDSHLKIARFHWYHFLPFLIYKIFYIQVFFLSTEDLQAIFQQISMGSPPFHITLSSILLAVIGVIYSIIALIVFTRYSVKIQNIYSSLDKINLYWLRFFTYTAMFVWSVVLTESILSVSGVDVKPYFILVPVLTSIFVYATGYIGLYKTEIFEQPEVQKNLKQAHEIEERKYGYNDDQRYQKSGLSERKASQYLEKLKRYMEEEKPYLKSNLTLNDLSNKLGISNHNLSEILNTHLKQNFFDFVNQYRVEEVKKYLADKGNDHLTLLSIAFDAGFNSKSGFNAIFKKYINITPSEYRQKLRT
jgi:AraC-like DNA-binding protein